MAWFLPSFGRPHALREMLAAPGGWPKSVTVLVNDDDPQVLDYYKTVHSMRDSGAEAPWLLVRVPAGTRCADAHRIISQRWPNEEFYGLLCDDQWPVTPGWWMQMEKVVEDRYVVTPNGEVSFPLIRNAVALGGELVRAMGSLVPIPVRHNYEDNLWDQVAADFRLLRPLGEVYVQHRHWSRGEAKKDATYERGSIDTDQDAAIFRNWLNSRDRLVMNARIANFLGATVASIDPASVRLGIATPIHGGLVDIGYHKSLKDTLLYLTQSGIAVTVIEGVGGSHVGMARERLLWEIMRHDPTHILFIDSDMGWDPKLVTRLLCADHEFCAVAGVKKSDEVRTCVNFLPQQRFHPRTQFLDVKDVGFAFVLLKRSAIEKMRDAYQHLKYRADGKEEYALFLDMIHDGERLAEDLSFCHRWREIGGEIWIDPQAALIHAGRKEYTGRVSDLFKTA